MVRSSSGLGFSNLLNVSSSSGPEARNRGRSSHLSGPAGGHAVFDCPRVQCLGRPDCYRQSARRPFIHQSRSGAGNSGYYGGFPAATGELGADITRSTAAAAYARGRSRNGDPRAAGSKRNSNSVYPDDCSRDGHSGTALSDLRTSHAHTGNISTGLRPTRRRAGQIHGPGRRLSVWNCAQIQHHAGRDCRLERFRRSGPFNRWSNHRRPGERRPASGK